MGKDVFGTMRYGCTVPGCACTDYLCKIDAMTHDERVAVVVHHPRNSPEYVQCVCGHQVTQHRDSAGPPAGLPPAADGSVPLRKCDICKKMKGVCREPSVPGHLPWAEAFCGKCFTKPNAKGCKKMDEDGHWTTAAGLSAGAPAPEAAAADAAVAEGTVASVPTFDLGAFTHGSEEERAVLADAWDAAFREVGFCLLTNYEHILPERLIEQVRSEAADFFALPAEDKQREAYVDGTTGYIGPGGENVGASAGRPSAQPDLVESLNLPGYQASELTISPVTSPHARVESLGLPRCQEEGATWEARAAAGEAGAWGAPSWAGARLPRAEEYWAACSALMVELHALSERALALPAGFFDAPYARPGALLRLASYPPLPPAEPAAEPAAEAAGEAVREAAEPAGALRYGAHTDFDGFTILQRGGEDDGGAQSGGLEIQRGGPSGEWLRVPAPPRTLTINIGDLIARWTNDRWRATVHRVAPPSPGGPARGRGRLSLVFFSGPHPDTVVECLPSPKLAGPKRYAPITAYAHVEEKMRAATAAAAPAAKGEDAT